MVALTQSEEFLRSRCQPAQMEEPFLRRELQRRVPSSSPAPSSRVPSSRAPSSRAPSSSRAPASRVPAHPLLVQEAVLPVLVLLARPCVEAGRLEQSAHLRNDFLRQCRARRRARASRRWSDLALLRAHIPGDSWANAFLTCRLGQ